jgi:L-lactate dehydrogenase complex protein LldG
MSGARTEILERIRQALADVPPDEREEDVAVPRAYLTHEADATLDRFVDRVRDYKSSVYVVPNRDLVVGVEEALRNFGVARLVVPEDLPAAWIPEEIEFVRDRGLSAVELDSIGATLTGCALGIAETGTIVLDAGPAQGRRLLTLVPDVHICVVREDQVVDGVPTAMRALAPGLRATRRPLTFVSGPSATSDIELSRVEGVHGPRRFALVVVLR